MPDELPGGTLSVGVTKAFIKGEIEMGADPAITFHTSISGNNLMRNANSSQWGSMSNGVASALFGR